MEPCGTLSSPLPTRQAARSAQSSPWAPLATWFCAPAQSCPTLCDPMECSPPGFSVLGISQARILEWGAISSSRGSSRPRDRTCVSCSPALQAGSLPIEPSGKPQGFFWGEPDFPRPGPSVYSPFQPCPPGPPVPTPLLLGPGGRPCLPLHITETSQEGGERGLSPPSPTVVDRLPG